MFFSFREKIKLFLKKPFIRDVFGLQLNQFFYVFMVGVASILLARMLGREQYGAYVLAFALASLFTRFMQLGNTQTLLTLFAEAHETRSRENMLAAVGYFMKMNLILLAPFGVASIILAGPVSIYFYHDAGLATLARIIIVASVIGGAWQLVSVLFQAARFIKPLVAVESLDIALKKIFMVLAAYAGLGVLGVVWGNFFAVALSTAAAFAAYYVFRGRDSFLPSVSEIVRSARTASIRKYFFFDLGVSIDAIVSSLLGVLPILLIGIGGHSADVGIFSIAFAYMGLGGILLGPVARMLSVRLPQFYAASDSPWKKFMQASLWSGVMTMVIAIALFAAAPFLIPLLYGAKFMQSAFVARQLFAYSALGGASIGAGAMIRALRKNMFFAALNVVYLAMQTGGYFFMLSLGFLHITAMVAILTAYQIAITSITFLLLYYFHLRRIGAAPAPEAR